MLPRWLWGVGVLALGLWLGCGAPVPPGNGQRIISLSPSISRVLLALEVGDQIVAVDRFSRELPGLESVPSIGGLFSPDLERALELRPSAAARFWSKFATSYCLVKYSFGDFTRALWSFTNRERVGCCLS